MKRHAALEIQLQFVNQRLQKSNMYLVYCRKLLCTKSSARRATRPFPILVIEDHIYMLIQKIPLYKTLDDLWEQMPLQLLRSYCVKLRRIYHLPKHNSHKMKQTSNRRQWWRSRETIIINSMRWRRGFRCTQFPMFWISVQLRRRMHNTRQWTTYTDMMQWDVLISLYPSHCLWKAAGETMWNYVELAWHFLCSPFSLYFFHCCLELGRHKYYSLIIRLTENQEWNCCCHYS